MPTPSRIKNAEKAGTITGPTRNTLPSGAGG